jgi:hypothetical protein
LQAFPFIDRGLLLASWISLQELEIAYLALTNAPFNHAASEKERLFIGIVSTCESLAPRGLHE